MIDNIYSNLSDDIKKKKNNSILRNYINDILNYPVLNDEEKVQLFSNLKFFKEQLELHSITNDTIDNILINSGYNKKINHNLENRIYQFKYVCNMSNDEDIYYFKIYLKYFKILEKLITSNLRLVVKLAYAYCSNIDDILNYIQEGNIALRNAVLTYDMNKNIEFSTYASNAIINSFKKNKKFENNFFRFNNGDRKVLKKYLSFCRDYTLKYNRYPNYEEKVEFVYDNIITPHNDTLKKKKNIVEMKLNAKADVIKLDTMLKTSDIIYLDSGADSGLNNYSLIDSKPYYDNYESFELIEVFKNIFAEFSFRDKLVIILRYGLDLKLYFTYDDLKEHLKNLSVDSIECLYKNNHAMTNQEIGDILGISRQFVSRIECRVKNKIKKYSDRFIEFI